MVFLLIIAAAMVGLFFIRQQSEIKQDQKDSSNQRNSGQTANGLENLLVKSKINFPPVESSQPNDLPQEFKFLLLGQENVATKKLSYENTEKGYGMEFETELPLFSVLKSSINNLNSQDWEIIYGGYVENYGVISAKKDIHQLRITLTLIDKNHTKISIEIK